MTRDYLKWAALGFALVATASAEYELARAVGYTQWVAAAVPGALDVWTVRAMRQHRDVLLAVFAMIAVNALSHLVTAGLMQVNVPLVVGVSAIAPLVLYRVHHISREGVEEAPAVVEEAEVNTRQSEVDTAPAHPVSSERPAPVDEEPPVVVEEPPAPVEPLVICGARQVYTPAVPRVNGADVEQVEVNTEPAARLDAEQARSVIEACWVNGVSTREAARRATRSPAYVSKVYGELKEEPAGRRLALVEQQEVTA